MSSKGFAVHACPEHYIVVTDLEVGKILFFDKIKEETQRVLSKILEKVERGWFKMLKVTPPEGYPPEKDRYARGNDYSPVAVCVILDTFDFAIPPELEELVMAGLDSGAALSGMLQTEDIGLEKMICNVVSNPNIRYIVSAAGRLQATFLANPSSVFSRMGSTKAAGSWEAMPLPPTFLTSPQEAIERFRCQIITVIDLLCEPGANSKDFPGLNPETVSKAVWSCYQEKPVDFMGYKLYDPGAYPEEPILCKVVWKVSKPWEVVGHKRPQVSALVIWKLLPKTNCGRCGERTCRAFASKLSQWMITLDRCPLLSEEKYRAEKEALEKLYLHKLC
ncbi:MAG: hypothetical protein DRG31_07820 [Deltaproteobacteria bacterium]|nr:MAG: hypothetical protein DRG31_07820 [Deltaproteobacteria bacterium]